MSNFFTKQAAWDKIALDPGAAILGLSMANASGGGGGGGGGASAGDLAKTLGVASVASKVTSPLFDTTGYRVNKALNSGVSGLAARVKADELVGKKVVDTFGDLASKAINHIVDSGISKYKKLTDLPKQQSILKELVGKDDVISRADPEQVANLYESLRDIAPTVAKHREAVRSFLRQGLAHEGGVDPVTFGQLARTEQALKGKNTAKMD